MKKKIQDVMFTSMKKNQTQNFYFCDYKFKGCSVLSPTRDYKMEYYSMQQKKTGFCKHWTIKANPNLECSNPRLEGQIGNGQCTIVQVPPLLEVLVFQMVQVDWFVFLDWRTCTLWLAQGLEWHMYLSTNQHGWNDLFDYLLT